jgi:hypothetical protein
MRPAGLTAVCIISLCLGVLGTFGLLAGCFGLVAQPMIMQWSRDFQKSITQNQSSPQLQQMQEQQEAMLEELQTIQRKWLIPSVAGLGIAAVAVIGLIVGAIKGLSMKPYAHKWLIIGMSAAIIHSLVASFVGYVTQRETQVIMVRQMNQTMQQNTPGGMPPGATALTTNAMQLGAAIGMVLIFGWMLVKCGFYTIGIWYLLTPRIRQLFEGDGSDRAVIDALSDAPT